MLNELLPYFIAGVIGLLVGMEREKSHMGQKSTMGVRTFALISLLGALAGDFQNIWMSILLTAFTLGLIIVSYFIEMSSKPTRADRGLTTEFAAGIIFSLGYLAHEYPILSAILGPFIAVILFSKKSLHHFIHIIKPSELEAALFIFLWGVVVIGLVPDKTIDPFKIFNPRQFGYIVLTLAALEFLSYILTKIIGAKKSSLFVGFLGGFVSSTAVLISSARQSKESPENWRILLGSALAAKMAAIIELLAILGFISSPLFLKTLPSAGAGLAFCLFALVFIVRKQPAIQPSLNLQSPLNWKGVLRLSFVLAGILALISLAEKWFGNQGTQILSFLTGLFELHGVSIATATLHHNGTLQTEGALRSILLALIGSLVSKIVLSWIVVRNAFARAITFVFISTIVAVFLVYHFTTLKNY